MARGRGLGWLPAQMRVRDGDASRALKISDPRDEREVIVARLADTVVERPGSLGHEAGTPDERCAAVGATAFALQRAFMTRENCLELREKVGLHFLEAQQVGGQSMDPLKQTIPACFRMECLGLHPSVALGFNIGLSQDVVAHRSKRGRWCCVIHPASEPPGGHDRQDLDPDIDTQPGDTSVRLTEPSWESLKAASAQKAAGDGKVVVAYALSRSPGQSRGGGRTVQGPNRTWPPPSGNLSRRRGTPPVPMRALGLHRISRLLLALAGSACASSEDSTASEDSTSVGGSGGETASASSESEAGPSASGAAPSLDCEGRCTDQAACGPAAEVNCLANCVDTQAAADWAGEACGDAYRVFQDCQTLRDCDEVAAGDGCTDQLDEFAAECGPLASPGCQTVCPRWIECGIQETDSCAATCALGLGNAATKVSETCAAAVEAGYECESTLACGVDPSQGCADAFTAADEACSSS